MTDKTKVYVGTKLKVIAEQDGHEFDIGSVVEVIRIDTFDDQLPFLCKSEDGQEWWLGREEYEVVEYSKQIEAEYKVGDSVRVLKTGTHRFNIGDIATIECVHSGDRQPYRCGPAGSPSWLRPDECELVKEEAQAPLAAPIEVGDTVVVVADNSSHGFPIGTKLQVEQFYDVGTAQEHFRASDGVRVRFLNKGEVKSAVVEAAPVEKKVRRKKLANHLYAVVHKGSPNYIKVLTSDRKEAREDKAFLGGKEAGYIILKYEAVKEIR